MVLFKELNNIPEFDENIDVSNDVKKSENWNKYKEEFAKKLIKCDALQKKAKNFYKMY